MINIKKIRINIIIIFLLISFKQVVAEDTLSVNKSNNILSFFAGISLIPHADALATYIGLGYEHKLKGGFGFGFNASSYIFDYFEFSFALPFYYHPFHRLKVWMQPGIAFTKTISYSKNTPETDQFGNLIIINESNKYTGNFLFGVGTGYDFILKEEYPQIIVSPSISSNFVNFDKPYLTGLIKIEFNFLSK